MANYIDGFAFPIPSDHLAGYQRMAADIARIWIEHGALDYREYVGDDMQLAGTRSFAEALNTREDERVVFGWVAFESREARDRINRKVAQDPRVPELMGPAGAGFDASRMAYAGFAPLVPSNDTVAGSAP